MSASCGRCERRRSSSPGSGLDDPASNAELARHLDGMRANGAAVAHLSPPAFGDAEIGVDNAAGIASMIAALVGLGHHHIAFLAGPPTLVVATLRLDGYRRGLAEAGLEPDDALVVSTGFNRDAGRRGVDRLLAGSAEFTAICCANDLLALGALERLAELGLRVPDDVSVAGFDDVSVAALTAPRLSTVRLPLREMGRRGFEYVDRVLAGESVVAQRLPTELVLRESTGAPPAAALPGARLAPASRASWQP